MGGLRGKRRSRRIGTAGWWHFIPTTKKHKLDAEANKRRSRSVLVEITEQEMEALGLCNSRFDFYFESCPKGKIFLPDKDGKLAESTEDQAIAWFRHLEATRTHYWKTRMVKGKAYKYKRKLGAPLFEPVRTTIPLWFFEYWREAKLTEPQILEKLVGLIKKGAVEVAQQTGREVVAGTIHLDTGKAHLEWLTLRVADPAKESDLIGTKGLGLASEWFVDTWAQAGVGLEPEGKKMVNYKKAWDRLDKDYPGLKELAFKAPRLPLDLVLKKDMIVGLRPKKDDPLRPAFDRAVASYLDWKKNEQKALLDAAMEKRRSSGQRLANDAVRGLLQVALGQKQLGLILTKFAIEQIVELIIEKSPIVAEWFAAAAPEKKVAGGRNMGMEMGG